MMTLDEPDKFVSRARIDAVLEVAFADLFRALHQGGDGSGVLSCESDSGRPLIEWTWRASSAAVKPAGEADNA
jgi:hypothetical protein